MTGRFIGLFLAIMLSCSIFTGMASAQETETVYIGQGDHYDLGPYYSWGDSDLWVNMTVIQGGNVDVYVMNSNQYYNAYSPDPYQQGGQIPGGIAFKNCSRENVSQANIYLHIVGNDNTDMWGEDEVWVIIDNRDVNATPDDASPTGTVKVNVEADWVDGGYGFDDEFLWPLVLMILISTVPIVVIIVLLVVILIKVGKKKNAQTPMPYYYSYPPPVPPAASAPPVPPHEHVYQEPISPETKE